MLVKHSIFSIKLKHEPVRQRRHHVLIYYVESDRYWKRGQKLAMYADESVARMSKVVSRLQVGYLIQICFIFLTIANLIHIVLQKIYKIKSTHHR